MVLSCVDGISLGPRDTRQYSESLTVVALVMLRWCESDQNSCEGIEVSLVGTPRRVENDKRWDSASSVRSTGNCSSIS